MLSTHVPTPTFHLQQLITAGVRGAHFREDGPQRILVLPNLLAGSQWAPEVFDVEVPLPTLSSIAPRYFHMPKSVVLAREIRGVSLDTLSSLSDYDTDTHRAVKLSFPKWSAGSSNYQTILTGIRRYFAQPGQRP